MTCDRFKALLFKIIKAICLCRMVDHPSRLPDSIITKMNSITDLQRSVLDYQCETELCLSM